MQRYRFYANIHLMIEKPKPMIIRFYKTHRKYIKKVAKVYKISEAEVVRRAIDLCNTNYSL